MTFSVIARDRAAGLFGMAIASSSPAVAARCAHARAGVGVVASQNVTDPRLGPRALRLMAEGAEAAEAVAILARGAHMAFRQVMALGREGPPGVHTGARGLGVVAEALGRDAAAAGNLLAHEGVPAAMLAALQGGGHLGDRLVAALGAGLAAGGEAGPVRSAGLLLVHEQPWPLAELRIDWAEDPVGGVAAAWAAYRPQMADYVARALDPGSAPAFGVPGDP